MSNSPLFTEINGVRLIGASRGQRLMEELYRTLPSYRTIVKFSLLERVYE